MDTGCPNLRELFGSVYKVSLADFCRGRPGLWLQEIHGRYGHIYPWGLDTLAVWTDRSKRLVMKLQAAGCELVQDGDREWTLTFPTCAFSKVARLIKAHRVNGPSEAQLAALEQGRQARNTKKALDKGPLIDSERTQTVQVDN